MNRNKELTPIRPLPDYLPVEGGPNSTILSPDEQNEVPLREYWQVVIKYRIIILASTVAVFVLALLYAFLATPYYTANTRIRINTYQPVLTSTGVESVLQEKSKEQNYLETQIQEIKSISLADKVLSDPALKKVLTSYKKAGFFSRFFGADDASSNADEIEELSGYKHPIKEIKEYLERLSVSPVRRTSLVNLQITAKNPRVATLIANKHATMYKDWVRDNWVSQQSHTLSFLKQQAAELRERVAELEREMAEYAEDNSIVAVNKDENITVQKMAHLNKLLAEVTARRIEAENIYREAKASLSERSAGFDDPSAQNIRSELARLRAEYSQLAQKFTDEYPRMKQLKSQIAELDRSVSQQRREIVVGLKAKAEAAKQEEALLKEELATQESKAFELAKREVQYNVLSRELDTSRELLRNVLRQMKETALAVEGKSSNVAIVDYAVPPEYPSFPNKKVLALLGLFMGVSVGLGLAFLLNYLDNTVRTPEEVTKLLGLPNLGVVPAFECEALSNSRDEQRRLGSFEDNSGSKSLALREKQSELSEVPATIFTSDPKSLASEAYRTIRTGILLSQAGEPPRTLLVSSAQSGEGKTTSTMNLAASLASAGARVVLIDADLRRPSLQRYFNIRGGYDGVVEIITGQRDLKGVIIKDVVKRVDLIPSGKLPPNPAELLGSIEMASVIDQLSLYYDYVIIDSPPVLPVTDSVILSRYVDGVVLVVKGGETPKRVVLDARKRLQSVGARFIGTILNDVDVTSGDYYYYNRYYHSYYTEGLDTAVKDQREQRA